MEQHRTITVEGRTVHYRDEGRENTRTLVLLHGFLQNLDVWSSYVLSYMNRFRVITIDLPGHGLTESFCDVHTMDFMAKIVKSVLNEAGVDQCVMVGHSMGGVCCPFICGQVSLRAAWPWARQLPCYG